MPRDDYLSAISYEMKARHLTLASNIKTARESRGWSQVDAARRCVVSLGAYRAAEEGNLGTAIGVYWAILDCFGVASGVEDLAAPHKDEQGRLLRERKHRK